MLEFFEKNLGFLIFATIVGSFVIWSVRKENKEKDEDRKDRESNKKKENK